MSCGKSQLAYYKVLSWWDMKPFPIVNLLRIVRGFEQLSSVELARGASQQIAYGGNTPEAIAEKQDVLKRFARMAQECEDCSLTSSADQFHRLMDEIEEGVRWERVKGLLPDVVNRIEDECKRHHVLFIEPSHVKYFSDPQFFDPADTNAPKVSTAFPSAAEDIAESGKCLACGRSTACVMHLGRVAEVGLKALANALAIKPQNDWGRYLSGIDTELQNRLKAAGARSKDEQFYSEAHLTFDTVRRAWRNPTMHIEKTYTVERAEEILIAVRSFMRHLATRLSE